jgi:hypothetical protein
MLRAQEVSMNVRSIWPLFIVVSTVAACGKGGDAEQQTQPAMQAEPVAEAPAAQAPVAAAVPAVAELPAVPAAAKVRFLAPADGAVIEGPLENGKIAVAVKMGVEGIELKPAGPVEAGSGHHHILIDVEPIAAGTVIPMDEQHVHFGKAQTEATLALTPGPHRLSLQFADGVHRSYGPQLAATIAVSAVAAGTVAPAAKGSPARSKPTKAAEHDPGHAH